MVLAPSLRPQLPAPAVERLTKAGIDISDYPYYPQKPDSLDVAKAVQGEARVFIDRGSKADPEKKALFSAAKEVKHLSAHIGTEIVGLQLAQLTDQQKDELALLIAERTVVFFRDQDLTPQQQRDLGAYWGEVEVHPTAPQVPGVPGVGIIWPALYAPNASFRTPFGTQNWHTDLTHHRRPPGITHLHNDTVPEIGGDTYWASGYAAYDKLSPRFRTLVEGLNGVFRSAHSYKDPSDPDGPEKYIERIHPLVRVHPATGWKSLFLNRGFTKRIDGLDQGESDAILNYLFDVYEKSLDIQVRFKWSPHTSALWDNRVSIHAAVFDYENKEPRHGTRVASLAEEPFLKAGAPSRRQALGLDPSH